MGRGDNLLYDDLLLSKRNGPRIHFFQERFPHGLARRIVAGEQGVFFLNSADDFFYINDRESRLLCSSEEGMIAPHLSPDSLSWANEKGEVFSLDLYADLAMKPIKISSESLPGQTSRLCRFGDHIYLLLNERGQSRARLFRRNLTRPEDDWHDFQALRARGEEVVGIDAEAGVVFLLSRQGEPRAALIHPSGDITRSLTSMPPGYLLSPRIAREGEKVFYTAEGGLASFDFRSEESETLGPLFDFDLNHDFCLTEDRLFLLGASGAGANDSLLRVYRREGMHLLQEINVAARDGLFLTEDKLGLYSLQSEEYSYLLLSEL